MQSMENVEFFVLQ